MGANSKMIQRKMGKNLRENKILRSRYEFHETVKHTHSIKTIADHDGDSLRRVNIVLQGLYIHMLVPVRPNCPLVNGACPLVNSHLEVSV